MILSTSVLLCVALATLADASAIKGRHHEPATKGGIKGGLLSPVELRRDFQQQQQQATHLPLERRELSKTSRAEPVEQREWTSQRREELPQQHEEAAPTKGEKPALKTLSQFEAKPQIRAEEWPAKGQDRPLAPIKSAEQREELPGSEHRHEQQKQSKLEDASLLPQQREEPKHEEARKGLPARQEPIKGASERAHEPELAKGQTKLELEPAHQAEEQRNEWTQLPEQQQQKHEENHQQREEALKSTETVRRTETIQQQHEVVELTREVHEQQQQIRQEPELIQQQQQHEVQWQQQQEETRVAAGVKGAAVAFAEAEPYSFDYSVEGSSRRETGDVHGVVRGQYTVLNGDGSQRVVDYIADRDGFRAQVNTGELGTESQQPANVLLRSSQPAAQDISLRLEGKTREFLTAVPQAPVAPLLALTKTAPARPDNWNTKTHWDEEQQQQHHLQGDRKGGAKLEEQQQPELIQLAPVKAPLAIQQQQQQQQLQAEEPLKQEALKGEPLKQESIKQEPLKQEPVKQEADLLPIKQAEPARTPKAIAELKSQPIIQARASFESATAHRPLVHVAPAQPLVHHHHHHHQLHRQHLQPVRPVFAAVAPPSPVRSYQHLHRGGVPSRAQLQHDRYPPQPLNPRVSFYSADNFDEEPASASSGFEHPINSS